MSKTRKCDRCGKIYGLCKRKGLWNVSNRIKITDVDEHGNKLNSYRFDLCHECSDSLIDFLTKFNEDTVEEDNE